MRNVFDFSKEYERYVYYVNYKTSTGKFRRVKGLPVYETYEQAEIAAKKYTVEKCYIHRDFAR